MDEESAASLTEIIVGWTVYLAPIVIVLGVLVWIARKSRQSVRQSLTLQEESVQLQRETLLKLGEIEELLSDQRSKQIGE